jgi:hypothetical protein
MIGGVRYGEMKSFGGKAPPSGRIGKEVSFLWHLFIRLVSPVVLLVLVITSYVAAGLGLPC